MCPGCTGTRPRSRCTAYDDTDPDHPAPRFGHPKDRRLDLKQIQAELAVTGDGAVPVFHRAYAGGAGEVFQLVAAMRECQKWPGGGGLLSDTPDADVATLRLKINCG